MIEKRANVFLKDVVVLELNCCSDKVVENKLEFASSPEEFDRLYQIILAALQKKKYYIEDIRNILLCINEAYANAVMWGNNNNKRKKIIVRYYVSKSLFGVSIEDEGAGFDVDRIISRSFKINQLQTSGRGIYFMHHYMDRVIYNNKGNRVIMLHYNQSEL